MIIDAHAHYTSAPPQLQAYRGRQISTYARPAKARLQISDDELAHSLQGQFKRMDDWGIDRLMFSPQASAMGHQFGSDLHSRYWTEACNDLVSRAAKLWPDRISPVCQLPQSPGVNPEYWLDELERCVEMGFVSCNINPDISGSVDPFTPSMKEDWWYPLWGKMIEFDLPGTIHASSTFNPAHHVTASHYIAQHHSAGVEILGSRVFQDFPDLKIIIPHGGGAIPYQWSRHRGSHAMLGLEPFEDAARRVYWDMAIYDQESMEMLIKRVGVDNVLFATEMFGAVNAIDPQTGRSFEDVRSLFDAIDWLGDEDRQKIYEGNARKVYGDRLPSAS